jgi:hypothetical protein
MRGAAARPWRRQAQGGDDRGIMGRNWLDIAVVLVIGGFFLIGFVSGFIFSAFRTVSMFASLYLSVALHGKLAERVNGTIVEELLSRMIYAGFHSDTAINAAQRDGDIMGVMEGINGLLRLPPSVTREWLVPPESLAQIPRTSVFNSTDMIMFFSNECARLVISFLSIVVLYVAARAALAILKIFLDEVASLKAFRIFNFTIAPLLGVVEGFCTVYIAFALVMALNVVAQRPEVFELLDNSRLAKQMYENNMFLDAVIQNIHTIGGQ